jgi:hypothetical protein
MVVYAMVFATLYGTKHQQNSGKNGGFDQQTTWISQAKLRI